MFGHASSFNQELNAWNLSSVTDMGYMFFLHPDLIKIFVHGVKFQHFHMREHLLCFQAQVALTNLLPSGQTKALFVNLIAFHLKFHQVMPWIMVTIGMMTICTATAMRAKMKILPMILTNNQCKQELWQELHHHRHHQQQQQLISHQKKYVIILVTKNAPMFLRNPLLVLAVANKK